MTFRALPWAAAAVVLTLAALTPVAALGQATMPASPSATADDDAGLPFQLSLPTMADKDAWRSAGFRLHLGYGYGQMIGLDGTGDATTHIILVRAGVRLDEDWSLLITLAYAIASEGVSGLRFSGTIDPTWHLGDHFYLAMGAGPAGIVEAGEMRPDADPNLNNELVASYTYSDTTPLIAGCSGMGVAALLRAGATLVIGPLASTELSLQLDGQWIGCEQDSGRVEPDTAQAIVRRQWWPHLGANLAWTVAWR